MRRHAIQQIANELIRKVPLDTLRGAIPDIRGMLKEGEYRLMEKLGQRNKIPIPGMLLRRQIFGPDGHETFDSGMNRSDTVVRSYYNLLFCQGAAKNPSDTASFGTGFLSIKDTAGTIRGDTDDMIGHPHASDHDIVGGFGFLASAGVITNGIVAGTSSLAEDFESFGLTAIIANGAGGGQFDYAASGLHAITNSTLTLKDTVIRDMNNNSAGSITVEEVGIYTTLQIGGSIHRMMMTRDLTGGDVVASAAQYRVTYEITLVYPS